ncbi:MAG: hypothetical protein ACM4D3_12895 [Candidatus Sericytochromatia bacterium]
MTGPHDDSETRPISVAELLARNGTIGAPPVGGRRRRRRGRADAVTVAELTGEIPVIRDEAPAAEPPNGAVETSAEPQSEVQAEVETGPEVEAEGEAEREAEVEAEREAGTVADAEVPAEEMLPDPVDLEDLEEIEELELDEDEDTDDQDAAVAVEEELDELDEIDEEDEEAEEDAQEQPSYLDAVQEPLFGGRTDDLSRDGETTVTELPEVPAETTTAEDHEEALPPTRLQQIGRGALVVLQSILAVAFGAGLFIAFDQLWKWNNIVALVLAVLVILGLVVAVRVVRKTEDIGSTLIAVAVGALVTLGPLALLQSG